MLQEADFSVGTVVAFCSCLNNHLSSSTLGNEQGLCPGALSWAWPGVFLKFCSGLKHFLITNKIYDSITTTASSNCTVRSQHSLAHWGTGHCSAGHQQVGNNQLSSFPNQSGSAPVLVWAVLQPLPHLLLCFLLKNKVYNLNKAFMQTRCAQAGYRKVIQVPGCSCSLLERG